ncbi:MAG TPA: hypothetical protein VIC04_04830, partial [Terriglobia bacterium]
MQRILSLYVRRANRSHAFEPIAALPVVDRVRQFDLFKDFAILGNLEQQVEGSISRAGANRVAIGR